jgi:hypothetical protein
MVWIWVAAAWLAVGLVVSLLVVRSIRLADRRAASRAEEPNVAVDPGTRPSLHTVPDVRSRSSGR